jgi:hypothetical protein
VIGQPTIPTPMVWLYVKNMKNLDEIVTNWSKSTSLPVLDQHLEIMKLLELLREHLCNKLGVHRIPLACIVCENMDIVMTTSDPNYPALPYLTSYDTFHDKMITRASRNHTN